MVETVWLAVGVNVSKATGVVSKSVARVVATAQNGLEVMRFGGLDTGSSPSEFAVADTTAMYRLRHYFPGSAKPDAPVVVFVPPLMMSADIYDVNTAHGAVALMRDRGVDAWVVDFGSPEREVGGLKRTLADHVAAVSDVVSKVNEFTGKDVHLAGYSQGGLFCYQAAAYRKSRGLASVITFGSPVDTLAALPLGVPAAIATRGAEVLADHVFTRIAVPSWAARAGFNMLDPVKYAKSRIDFLLQLHDREALLPREEQRRFLAGDGWVAYAGPAVADFLKQFIVHNRLMTGGFVINEQLVTLAEITVPVLAFIGEVDEIGQPTAARGIRRAAPAADIYEYVQTAGHFGLVVGTAARQRTWPTVAQWIGWQEGHEPQPEGVVPMPDRVEDEPSGFALARRLGFGLTSVVDVGAGLGRNAVSAAVGMSRASRTVTVEAIRTLPRLTRLGQIQGSTRVSLGQLMNERARRDPRGDCLLFDDRVHTNEAVDTRIDNVVRGFISQGLRHGSRVGVLMETRPSALVTISALSRIGAVAVLLPHGRDTRAAAGLGGIEVLVVDPPNLAITVGLGVPVLVLGGGETRELDTAEADHEFVDLEQIDPTEVELPGWYRPNPAHARELAFVLFRGTGESLVAKNITNHRWAVSAFGTASAAALTTSDTVYCLSPLHSASGLLASVGGSVAGGSRIALSRGLQPERFVEEIHRYGVTVVAYTWSMMAAVVDADPTPVAHHPVRLFIGSGMPTGLWQRVTEKFRPAKVLEFFATTEGDAVLANVSAAKIGSKGRPLPGSARLKLAAYDAATGSLVLDERGFVRESEPTEIGMLLSSSAEGFDSADVMRGVFEPGDHWRSTDYLFRKDSDGDYWLVDYKYNVIKTAAGPVFTEPISSALGLVLEIVTAVTYGVRVGDQTIAVSAVTLAAGQSLSPATITSALAHMEPAQRPKLVYVLDRMPMTASYRADIATLRDAGLPRPSVRSWHLDSAKGSYRRYTTAVAAKVVSSVG